MAGTIISGLNAVEEALKTPGLVNRLYVMRGERSNRIDALLDRARELNTPFDFVPPAKMGSLAQSTEHQGIAAAISPIAYTGLPDALAACGDRAHVIVLDQVQHARNLGMLIRSAAASGAACVIVSARGGALLDDTVLRASAGAVFRVPIVRCNNIAQTLRALRDADFWLYGLDGHADQDLFATGWPPRVALVVGNETDGLRHGVKKTCDALVKIPLAQGVESLNVSVAAGIALFQIAQSLTGRG